ncbi:Aminotran_1_2 domain-containing protein [Psidium guajava]|nr:Aminotran_1_2 domain-containing protein [Psidium guajava]
MVGLRWRRPNTLSPWASVEQLRMALGVLRSGGSSSPQGGTVAGSIVVNAADVADWPHHGRGRSSSLAGSVAVAKSRGLDRCRFSRLSGWPRVMDQSGWQGRGTALVDTGRDRRVELVAATVEVARGSRPYVGSLLAGLSLSRAF